MVKEKGTSLPQGPGSERNAVVAQGREATETTKITASKWGKSNYLLVFLHVGAISKQERVSSVGRIMPSIHDCLRDGVWRCADIKPA